MSGSTDTMHAVRAVESFLEALERLDYDAALALCAPDVVWINAPVTTARGKEHLAKVMRAMFRDVTLFRVEDMKIHQRGDGVVVTDRVDVIEGGGVKMRLRVHGDFEVRNGLLSRWTDRFSWPVAMGQTLASLPAVLRFRFANRRPGTRG